MTTFLVAAALLSLERLFYVWISHRPRDVERLIRARTRTSPVVAVQWLFAGFKAIQLSAFVLWVRAFGGPAPWPVWQTAGVMTTAIALVLAGQALNLCVFYRLGRTGVFYGAQFGYEVAYVRAFPFSWFAHPQYVGAVLSIWGCFLALRFPHADWYVLPVLETVYYVIGARLERPSAPRPTLLPSLESAMEGRQ
ncbi:MAG TPA: methyltransferase [Vicinamibacterales bacterium]|nr:methyltransferase [Vicinamibacterales bacterium]